MRKINKNVQNTYDDINNTIRFLKDKNIVYYFRPSELRYGAITWSNHVPGGYNGSKFFNSLKQYEYIIENGAYQCILFDGSIIRTSFFFDGARLIKHSHLWWPAPYALPEGRNSFMEDVDEENRDDFLYPFNKFLKSSDWVDLRMRSPVRIDYDSYHANCEDHPLVHMHVQDDKTRMNISQPISFYTFVRFIIVNFYPDIEFNYNKQPLKYSISNSIKSINYKFSSILI